MTRINRYFTGAAENGKDKFHPPYEPHPRRDAARVREAWFLCYSFVMSVSQEIIDRTFHSAEGAAAYKAVEILLDAGYEAWWVGGCVRDMLLGEIPKDIDIATSATPQEIIGLFPKNDDIAAALGAVIIAHEGHTFEVTTFREEAEAGNGRQPESVVFTTRQRDAQRRDITMNALYWHPISSELYDPFGGEHDLTERLVRFIGDPATRIEEDALRLLRVVRFRALVAGQYHPDTFQALHAKAKNIEVLSGSRAFQELEKMLLGPHPEIAFEDLWETDILEYLLPELHKCKGVAQPADYHKEGDVWNHTMMAIAACTEDHGADVRWATLFHDVGKAETFSLKERIRFDEHAPVSARIAGAMLQRLQCTKKRIQKIQWIVGHHMMMGSFADMNEERKSHWYYHPWFTELLQLFWLDIGGTEPRDYELYERIVRDWSTFLDSHPLPPKPLLKGEEVITLLGIQPGEKVGEVMKALYDAQVRKEITTKKEAETYLQTHF